MEWIGMEHLNINQTPLILGLIYIGMVIFVYIKNPGSRVVRSFMIMAIFGIGVLFSSGLIFSATGTFSLPTIHFSEGFDPGYFTLSAQTLFNRLLIAFVVMWLAGTIHFALQFNSYNKEAPRAIWQLLIIYIPAFLLALISISTDLFIIEFRLESFDQEGIYYSLFQFKVDRDEGLLYKKLFIVYFAIALVTIFYIYIQGLRKSQSDIERSQILFSMLGFVPGVAIGLVASAVLPALKIYEAYALGISTAATIILAMVFYTIIAHGMMNISTVIHKTVIWIILSVILWIPVYITYIILLQFDIITLGFFEFLYNNPEIAVLFLGMLFATFTIYFRYLQPVINNLFQRKKYDLEKELNAFINKISLVSTFGDLNKRVINLLNRVLYVDNIAIVLRNDERQIFEVSEANYKLPEGLIFSTKNKFIQFLKDHNEIAELGNLITQPEFIRDVELKESAIEFFEKFDAKLCIPLVYQNILLLIITLSGKKNLKNYTYTDFEFLNKLELELVISYQNSILYENNQNQLRQLTHLHAELKMLNEELEKKVEDRTKDLSFALKELEEQKKITDMELDKASIIQQGLYPILGEEWHGIRFACKFEPLAKVSGDYYDIFTLPNESLGVLVADVSGHGIPAALVTTMLKTTVSQITQSSNSTSEILNRLNKRIVSFLTTEEYLTAFFLAIDKHHEIRFTNAGHQKALLIRHQDGSVEELDSEGMIIGAFETDFAFGEGKNKLLPGDRIAIFTDGIIEGKNEQREEYGLDRLVQLILEESNTDLDTLIEKIYTDYVEYTQGKSNDDLTLLLLEVDPKYASFRAEINQGINLYNRMRHKEALPYLEKAYQLKPDHLRVLLALGKNYFKLREFNKAIEYYLKYLEIDNTDAEIFYNLGTCYYYTGELEKAVEMNKKAIAIRRNFVHAYFNLGVAYKKLNQNEEAINQFRHILELEPTHKFARQELKSLTAV